ncbi:MAG: hypothetical protein PVI26_06715, partial [Chitinispirillia bacterium]
MNFIKKGLYKRIIYSIINTMKKDARYRKTEKLFMTWPIRLKKNSHADIMRSFLSNLEYTLGKDEFTFT